MQNEMTTVQLIFPARALLLQNLGQEMHNEYLGDDGDDHSDRR